MAVFPLLFVLLGQQSEAGVLHHVSSGASVYLPLIKDTPNLPRFDYSYSQFDSRRGPLVWCRDNLALLATNGGLHLLDTVALDLRPVGGAEGFKLDGHLGVEEDGEDLLITKAYEPHDGGMMAPSSSFRFDFKSGHLSTAAAGPSADEVEFGGNFCDLSGMKRLEVTPEGLRIGPFVGPSAVVLRQRAHQDGAISMMEQFPQGGDFQEAFALESLLETTASEDEKAGLLARVRNSGASGGMRLRAGCLLTAIFESRGERRKAAAQLKALREELSSLAGLVDLAQTAKHCQQIGRDRPELPLRSMIRIRGSGARKVKCWSEYHVGRVVLPATLMLGVLKKRIASSLSQGAAPENAYRDMLLYEYLAKNVVREVEQPPAGFDRLQEYVALAVKTIVHESPELAEARPAIIREQLAFVSKQRERLSREIAELRNLTIYGPHLRELVEQLRREGELARGDFRSRYEIVSEGCR